jgi:hypothetical protein
MKWSKAARKMVPVILVSSLAIIIAGAVLYRSLDKAVPFMAGVLAMTAFNIYKVYLIERTIRKTLEMTDIQAGQNYIRLQAFLRFFLTGAALLATAFAPLLFTGDAQIRASVVYGACAGAVTFHIAAFSMRFMKLYDDEEEGDRP